MNRLALGVSLVLLGIGGVRAQTNVSKNKLPTVAEATELSEQTGRPIFAMAGRET